MIIMSNNVQLTVTAIIGMLGLLLVNYYFLKKWKKNTKIQRMAPQPSGSWPFLGHLPLLGDLPHITLGTLADQYGPIFRIKLGVKQVLVVSTKEMAKECLGKNDDVFVNRPNTIFVEHLGYNSAMRSFSPYNQYWRELNKITKVELLSNHRVDMLRNCMISEVRLGLKQIFDMCNMNKVEATCSVLYDMKHWFNDISMNSIVKLIVGKSLKEFYQGEEYNKCAKALRDFFELAGAHVLGDALPYMRWLDIGGYEKKMKRVAKDIDNVAQKWLEEHKQRRLFEDTQETKDFMDVMLSTLESGQACLSIFEADTIIKANCMNLILAASDTTLATLTWTLSLLLNNKDVLKKTQAELDSVVGNERLVKDSDLKSLVYIQAVLKESMRLYPPGPLLVPRESVTDCMVNGYHVPAGTHLYVNLYKIQRDPKVWRDPLNFHPERFLTTHKDIGFSGNKFEFMPFGSGRRICPGIYSSLQIMMFTLANLLHEFDILTPSNQSVDMSEGFGLTNLKATPLEVILTPRLTHHLYNNLNCC